LTVVVGRDIKFEGLYSFLYFLSYLATVGRDIKFEGLYSTSQLPEATI